MVPVQLSDGCSIMPDQVQAVTANALASIITVRMKDGIGHYLAPDPGLGVYQTRDRLVKQINEAQA